MSNEQLGQLTRLMHHMVCHRIMLPLDTVECRRIAQATTRDQHRELDRLLADHFTITELGREPATQALRVPSQVLLRAAPGVTSTSRDRYVSVTSQRDVKAEADVTAREHNKLRQKRHRERLEPMIEELHQRGITTRKNPTLTELQQLLDVTLGRNAQDAEPLRQRDSRAGLMDLEVKEIEQPIPADDVTVAAPVAACIALRRLGIADCSSSHPVLLALLRAGVSVEEIVDAGRVALTKATNGHAFAYALQVAKSRRLQADDIGQLPAKQDFLDKWGVRKH